MDMKFTHISYGKKCILTIVDLSDVHTSVNCIGRDLKATCNLSMIMSYFIKLDELVPCGT